MALTRKFLSALGIEAEKIDEIIDAHVETVNALKEERDNYKAEAEKLPAAEDELKKAKEQLENAGNDEFKEKYEALKSEYDGYKAEQEAKVLNEAKGKAYKAMLAEAGISATVIDSVMNATDLKDIELDGENLKDKEGLMEAAKIKWAGFITSEGTQGANTHTPPDNNGGNTKPLEEMSMAEYIAARNK